jgi:cytochrome c oxidase assembly protein subunit 15
LIVLVVRSRLSSFQRLAIGTTAITYFLILVGGLVRASGAGLGCPDWPRCFGSWIPPASAADLPPQFDASQFNPMLMWTEYLNRLLGVIVGFLILATVVSAWRHHRREPRILWSSIAALLLTGFQGWLGGRVVAHELAAWIVTAHLIVAIVIVSLLIYATVTAFHQGGAGRFGEVRGGAEPPHPPHPPAPSSTSQHLSIATAILILFTLVQVAIGTQVRGGVDAALDASVPRGDALNTVGLIDHFHRNSALVVLAGAVLVTILVWKRFQTRPSVRFWAVATVDLAFTQVALGIVMAYVSLAPAAQVAHLTVATLLLGAEMVLLLLLRSEPAAP